MKTHVAETGIVSGVLLPVDVWGALPRAAPGASTSHRLFVPNPCPLVTNLPNTAKGKPFTALLVATYPYRYVIGQDI
jgi:hypothetical protein